MTGDDDTGERSGMAREDRIAIAALSAIAVVLVVGLLVAIRAVLGALGASYGAISDGVGIRGGFIAGTGISPVLMIVMALVAGEGMVGELGVMILGFFVMTLFLTISVAVIL